MLFVSGRLLREVEKNLMNLFVESQLIELSKLAFVAMATTFSRQQNFSRLLFRLRGGGYHSNLGCRNTFLKIVSLFKNYRPEEGKVYIFGKLSALGFQKYQNHYHRCYR